MIYKFHKSVFSSGLSGYIAPVTYVPSFFLLYFASFCSEAPQSRESTVLCNSLKVFKSLKHSL